eukprot:968717_1
MQPKPRGQPGYGSAAVPNTYLTQASNDLSSAYFGSSWGEYFSMGFAFFQMAVDSYILGTVGGPAPGQFLAQPYPTPEYVTDPTAVMIGNYLGLFVSLSMLWVVVRVTIDVVEEKELRIKEGMKMMGLKELVGGTAHFATQFVIYTLTCALITAFSAATLFKLSNAFLIFMLFLLLELNVFAFCYLVSAFFSRARVAAIVAAMLFLGLYALNETLGSTATPTQRYFACLSPPSCFAQAGGTAIAFESAQIGLNFSNTNTARPSSLSVTACLLMLALDFVLYLGFGLYLTQVVPS